MTVKLKVWFLETRPQFLLLSVALAFLGTSAAWYDGQTNLVAGALFSGFYAFLGFLGLTLTHVSVNTLNDYYDYNSGIDLATRRTPFSGGSGVLPSARLMPKQVLGMGIISLVVAAGIGLFFASTRGWLLLPLIAVAAACIIFYTPFILKTYWPEWAAGLGLGLLPVLGAYFIQSSSYTFNAFIAAVPAFFLVHNLLLINEFPDVDADKIGRRRTLPIVLGMKRAGFIYTALIVATYLWVAIAVIFGWMPVFNLLAFLTVPFAAKAIRGATQPDDPAKLMPALANDVLVVLATIVLLGIGYLLAGVLG